MHTVPRLARWILAIAVFLFILMSVMRLATWWYFSPADLSVSSALSAFWMGIRYDAREIGIICLLLLLPGSIGRLHPFASKAGKRVSLTLVLLALLMVVIFYVFDFLHFRYLLQRLNASALGFLEDAKISGSMVWQTYPVVRIVLAMLVAIFLLYFIVKKIYRRIERKPYKGSKRTRIIWGMVLFFCCAFAIFGRIGQYPLRWSDAFNLGSDFKANLALNPFQSFFSSLKFRNSSFDENKVKNYYPLMADYLGVANPDTARISFARRVTVPVYDSNTIKPNIVLVICESFSAYKSSMWGNPLNTTPFFNEMCKQGLFFDNCFTPSYGTARGIWATITGIPDVELNKTASRNPSMVDQHTIINDFEGYEKFYFLGGSTSWANIRGLLTNNIKDLHLYEQENYSAPKIDVWGISDKNLFLESNKVLRLQSKPFFAVIQTADNHRPYTIPEEDLQEFKKVTVPLDSLKRYGFESNEELNAFRYTDYGYQKFIEVARKEKYFENTIFMFIGDHGIQGNAGTMFPPAWSDRSLTSYHVPLLFYSPKLLSPQRLHCVASQVDVLPTLAGMANINYTNTTLGRDLVQQHKTDAGSSNMAFIFDPNNNDIGVIKGEWLYMQKQEKMWWADFNNAASTASDSLKQRYGNYTNALHETARYMLMKNKK
jgi:phosphoglycerol transferase MdoB-like AlkP superfamily enzyme